MKNGFTLIELMIVFCILGILASVSVAAFNGEKPKHTIPIHQREVCVSGFKFVNEGKTQIINENGNGIRCEISPNGGLK